MRASESSLATMQYKSEQASDAPDGFTKSIKVTVTTAEGAVNAADLFYPLHYRIEAQDLQHLKYGSSSAKAITISFWVKSSVTGTYVLGLYAPDNTRAAGKTYTISSANTWEYKTLTFNGDTTDAPNNDNGIGIELYFLGGAGSDHTSGTLSAAWQDFTAADWAAGQSVNLQNTLNSTWQCTGLQVELGEQDTPFEHRSFGEELALCQRYCFDMNPPTGASPRTPYIMGGAVYNDTLVIAHVSFPVEMRTTPTVTLTGDSGDFSFVEGNQTRACTSFGVNGMTNSGGGINWTCGGGGMTSGNAGNIYIENDERCIMDAEL
jgi:hypothetical protein